ncbi:hypothetical protein [Anabaena sp. PCC 7108]|uniref:hypothetical protein n=1 Tax=Anabaena sp. PCC 7108 TaxID=163908 RepID=UPI0003493D6C|nr:hypothetical protein [Anabaena sp. PCC 7108]
MNTLFNLADYNTVTPVRDPYWDEIVLDSSGSCDDNGQITLFYDDSQEPPDPDDYPSLESYEYAFEKWQLNSPEVNINQMSVLEDEVISIPALPEHKKSQWTEEYSVTRCGGRYWYFRYCWYNRTTRRISHIHIPGGNSESAIAIERKEMIERAIALGKGPMEIQNFIRGGFGMNGYRLI